MIEREIERKITSNKWIPASLFRQFTWIDCSKIATNANLWKLAIAAIIIADTIDGNVNEHWSVNSNHTLQTRIKFTCTHTHTHTNWIQIRLHKFQVRKKIRKQIRYTQIRNRTITFNWLVLFFSELCSFYLLIEWLFFYGKQRDFFTHR